MAHSIFYFLLAGLRLAAADQCPGPAADTSPADPALEAASGVVMLATKSVVSKHSHFADSEGTMDTTGIETAASLITKVLETPRGSEIEPALLEGLATMKITPEVAAFIKATLATLAPVFGNISEASSNATKLCDKMHASFADLDKELNSTKKKVKSLEESATNAGKVHGMCRLSENSALAAKNACDLQKEVLAQKLKVATVEVQTQQAAQQQVVCGTSKNDVTGDNEDFVKKLKDSADAMAKAGKDFIEVKANHTAKGKECVGLSDGHIAKKKTCDQDQKDLEAAVCKQASTSQDGCKLYESTFQTRLNDYQNVVDNVALQQADRLSEWKHLKRIQCVLEAIGSAKKHGDLKAGGNLASQIQACYGEPFHNSGLITAAKPAPSPQSCPAVPELPCTAAYISQSYGGLPQDAPAATCSNGCAATTTTITTTSMVTPPPLRPTSTLCARIRNAKGPELDAVNGVDGNTYLSEAWGASDFTSPDASGNQCPKVINPVAMEIKVFSDEGQLSFETGEFSINQNVFLPPQGGGSIYQLRLTNKQGSAVSFQQIQSGFGAKCIHGNACEGTGCADQRTTFCVASGSTYQAILGGINGDQYGNGRGPCMCQMKTMCGWCKSKSVIEIYMKAR